MKSGRYKVIRLDAVAPCKLRVRFSNGDGGIHDCADVAIRPEPMAIPLRDPAYFARVILEFNTPT